MPVQTWLDNVIVDLEVAVMHGKVVLYLGGQRYQGTYQVQDDNVTVFWCGRTREDSASNGTLIAITRRLLRQLVEEAEVSRRTPGAHKPDQHA
jgi:hypothetical protein